MRTVFLVKRFLQATRSSCVSYRSILTKGYYCENAWKARLSCPVLQKVDLEEYVVRLQHKFETKGAASAVDMEILANLFEQVEPQQLDFAQYLFERYKKSKEYLKSKNTSTPYAMVRSLMAVEETDRLLEIVQDKIKYGIFLDNYCTNILIDYFLNRNKYQEAAILAYDQMLQEDFSDELTKALSWYACHLHWVNMGASAVEEEIEEKSTEEETEEEDDYIRVDYISRPYYDDHFDIPKDSMKLGKTFVMLSQGMGDIVQNSYTIVGYGLYEKFDKALEQLQSVLETEGALLAEKALESFGTLLENVETKEPPETEVELGRLRIEDLYPYITQEQKDIFVNQFKDIEPKLRNANKVIEYNLEEHLLKTLKQAMARKEPIDIQVQEDLFVQWRTDRENSVAEQMENFKISQRKRAIGERLLELQRKEEWLSYFDEQDRIHAGIQTARIKKAVNAVEEEVYVAAPNE